MKKLLIVLSSVRENRIADKILEHVQTHLEPYGRFEVTVADFRQMPLPFYDLPVTSSDERFQPTDPNAVKWTKMVADADAVLILTAEYNHSYTAVLKTAIDWIYKEWEDKPLAFIGYGWVGGARAINHLHGVFEFLKPKMIQPEANLRFKKEIELDGTVIDAEATASAIKGVLDALA